MSEIKELDNTNFSTETSKGKWAIDFWASWCGPCKMMAPHFEAASKEVPSVHFAKLDAQKYSSLAQEFQIRGIPCVIFIEDGKEIGRSVGFVEKEEIVSRVNEAFN